MFYYIGILFWCFGSFWTAGTNRLYLYFFLSVIGIFLCFGYMTGTDWRNYEPLYESVSQGREYLLQWMIYVEPGYALYNYFFGSLGISFWPFFIFTKVIMYCIFIRSLLYYCPREYLFLALLFFIAWYAYFLFIDNPMRNLIAVGIFLSARPFLLKRRFWPYLGLTLLAVSFHFSAIIMLVLYAFGNKSYSSRNILVIYIALNLLLLEPKLIYMILDLLFSKLPLVGNKIEAYSNKLDGDGGGKLISFGMIIHNIFFILFMLCRKRIEEIPHGKTIFLYSILFLVFFRLGLTITVMGRFQLYLAVFYCTSIGCLIKGFSKRSYWLYSLYVLLVSVLPCISYLVKDNRYIPYTNYLFYLGEEKTYEERSAYNDLNNL